MSEEQWQALFQSFNLQDVTWLYATLQGEAGLVSLANISSMGNINCCFKNCILKPAPFCDTVAILSLCCFNCMPVNLVVFQRKV